MPAVIFECSNHKEKAIIKIIFPYRKDWAERVKKLPQVQWSQTMKCWYVPDTIAYRQKFKPETKIATPQLLTTLSIENQSALALFIQQLILKSYSPGTVKTYRNEFMQLLQTLKHVSVNTLTHQRLSDYFAWCNTDQKTK